MGGNPTPRSVRAEEDRQIDYADFFPEENLLDALLSSDDSADEEEGMPTNSEQGQTRRTLRNVDGVASPGMSVAGRKIGRLQMMKSLAGKPSTSHASEAEDSSQPIAQRTRRTNRLPDTDTHLDDVLFDIDNEELEEIENFGKVFDDDEEYQKFLASLQHFEDQDRAGGGVGATGGHDARGAGNEKEGGVHDEDDGDDGDDEDDGDFIQELQEMIENEVDDVLGGQKGLFRVDHNLTSEMPIEKISSLFRKRGNYPGRKPYSRAPKELRRSLRVENQLNQKRRYAARLANKRGQNNARDPTRNQDMAALAALMGVTMKERDELAMKDGTQTPLPGEFRPGMFDQMAKSVVWKAPLPSTIRKAHSKLELVKEMAGNDVPSLELRQHIQLEMFTDVLRKDFMIQIRDHLQMCYQSLILAVVQRVDTNVVEDIKQTLVSSMQGLFPVLRAFGNDDVDIWEEGFKDILELVEGNMIQDQTDYSKRNGRKVPAGEMAAHVWSHLPYLLVRKTARIRACFDVTREPRHSVFRFTRQMMFTPAEDKLLAWGIRKYSYDWKKIREEFLPHRKAEQISLRKKNSVSANAKAGNIIAEAVRDITMPLTHAEIKLLEKATLYYGSRKGHQLGWESICRDYLPYRIPKVLSMLWADEMRRKASEASIESNQNLEAKALGPLLQPTGKK